MTGTEITDGLYHTVSGSTYEFSGKQMRRLVKSTASKSVRVGEGEWKPYEKAWITAEKSIAILWGYDMTAVPAIAKMTISSMLIDELKVE